MELQIPDHSFTCPYCGTHAPPNVRTETANGGWVMMILLFLAALFTCCLSLAFMPAGFLVRNSYRVCSQCGIRLG
jgi:hypothetical protein